MFSLKRYFAERAEKTAEKKLNEQQHIDFYAAAARQDVEAVKKILGSMKKFNDYFFDAFHKIMPHDNVEIFQALENYGDYRVSINEAEKIHKVEKSLLYIAIKWRAKNIALHLALDPKVDIAFSGTGKRRSESYEEVPLELPIELAREKGMSKIVSALANRMLPAEELRLSQLRDDVELKLSQLRTEAKYFPL